MLAPTVKSKKPKAEKRKALSSVTTASHEVVTNTSEYAAYLKELMATPYVVNTTNEPTNRDYSTTFPFRCNGLD